jgi:hypothetical protein
VRPLSIYGSIPVYPDFISESDLKKNVGTKHKMEFPTEMPLCEETRRGMVYYSFISSEAKEEWT